MFSQLQKKAAQAIVNIFETGSPHGRYGRVTVVEGDTGHLSYGRSQITLSGGNLYRLIKAYTDEPAAELGSALVPYLERLGSRDVSLDHDANLARLLRRAGEDPVMHAVQDGFVDHAYWNPSLRSARAMGLKTGLAISVIYDSRVHGSWAAIRSRTVSRHGTARQIGERNWIRQYVSVRRDWLASHSNPLLRRTTYRMDTFQALIDEVKWNLELPLIVRGVWLDEHVLATPPPPAGGSGARPLRLEEPPMTGADVKALQTALNNSGLALSPDGVFGPATEAAVRRYQQRTGLAVDGIVGPSTRASLGI